MPWFLVDDDFPSHPNALAVSLAARGLWVTSGAWCSKRLTDVVPDHVLASFGSTPELVGELCTAGMLKRARGGYRFIQEGTCRIPSKEAVENDRAKAAERKRRQRARHAGVTPPVTPMSRSGKPVQNDDDHRRPRSPPLVSRRDNGVTHAGTLDPDPDPSPVVEVINQPTGSNGRASPEMIELIIKEIFAATGHHLSDEWAQRTYANILGGRAVASPAAYIRQAIRAEPNPKKRFLPLY